MVGCTGCFLGVWILDAASVRAWVEGARILMIQIGSAVLKDSSRTLCPVAT